MAKVVVTGSTRGIGLGLVKEFRRLGHDVVVSSRGQAAVDAAVAEVRASPGAGAVVGQGSLGLALLDPGPDQLGGIAVEVGKTLDVALGVARRHAGGAPGGVEGARAAAGDGAGGRRLRRHRGFRYGYGAARSRCAVAFTAGIGILTVSRAGRVFRAKQRLLLVACTAAHQTAHHVACHQRHPEAAAGLSLRLIFRCGACLSRCLLALTFTKLRHAVFA